MRQLFPKDLANLKRLQTSLNTCIRLLKWEILRLRGSSYTSSACTPNAEVYSKSPAILGIISGNIQGKGLSIAISVERHLHRVEI
jgi:hypothetical protein